MHERINMHTQFWWRNLTQKDHLVNLNADDKINETDLKQNERIWLDLIGPGEGLLARCEYGTESSISIERGYSWAI
jgi:hypothetical protein